MILVWTCRGDKTVDWFIDRHLSHSGIPWVRFDSDAFPEEYKICADLDHIVVCGRTNKHIFNSAGITSVWYRRNFPSVFQSVVLPPEVLEYARSEAQSALSSLNTTLGHAYWVNKPNANQTSSEKLAQLLSARKEGLRVPKTLITNDPVSAAEFAHVCGGVVIVKPLRKGTISLGKVFYSTLMSVDDIQAHADSIAVTPVIFQEPIKKDYELRIVVINDECFGVKIFSQEHEITSVDWRRSPLMLKHKIADLPGKIIASCVAITRMCGLVYSAFDFIVTPDGEYVFLEHNPAGQFAWLEELTGIPIGRKILDVLTSPPRER